MLTIKYPITGQDFLMVGLKDFPDRMDYKDAFNASEKLGEGWRLPTLQELNEIYLNKDAIGGFIDSYYWSDSISNENECWLQDFENGEQYCGYANSGMVRAVCNI